MMAAEKDTIDVQTEEVSRLRRDRRAYAERCWEAGFHHALYWYGIWKDGVQTIGCRPTPIKDAMPQEGQCEYDLAALDVAPKVEEPDSG